MNIIEPLHGRGSAGNPANRFESIRYEPDPEDDPTERPSPRTQFFRDRSRTIIAYNDSPDVGFSASINPYRGCEHGCIYCYARPTHEYLGLSAGLDFETKIFVKEDAALLLRAELTAQRWQPQVLGISGVTDPYQPIERKLRLTRQCLEVLSEFRNPAIIVTKSQLVTRDLDHLSELARHQAIGVCISITSLDAELQRVLEPRATHPAGRLAALQTLVRAGIPAGVLIAPVIPGLNDHEIPAILAEAARAGAVSAGYVMLRLPYAVAGLFEQWLEQHYPERKEKVLHRIRELRGGRLNDPRFGSRMRGEGFLAETVSKIFRMGCRRGGIRAGFPTLSIESFQRPADGLLPLFERSDPRSQDGAED
jgi:DNA repair photolyase